MCKEKTSNAIENLPQTKNVSKNYILAKSKKNTDITKFLKLVIFNILIETIDLIDFNKHKSFSLGPQVDISLS